MLYHSEALEVPLIPILTIFFGIYNGRWPATYTFVASYKQGLGRMHATLDEVAIRALHALKNTFPLRLKNV